MKMKKSGFAAFSLFSPRPSRSPGLPGGRRRARFPRPNVGGLRPPTFLFGWPGGAAPGPPNPAAPRVTAPAIAKARDVPGPIALHL